LIKLNLDSKWNGLPRLESNNQIDRKGHSRNYVLENLLGPFTDKSVTFADGSVPHGHIVPGSSTIPIIISQDVSRPYEETNENWLKEHPFDM